MKKEELRKVSVIYCDWCGKEITGDVGVIHNIETKDESHYCKEMVKRTGKYSFYKGKTINCLIAARLHRVT